MSRAAPVCPNSTARRLLRRLLVIGWAIISLPILKGSTPSEWRFWQYEQGLADSYVAAISRSPGDVYWVCHGEVPALSRMDGREIRKIPAPRVPNGFDSLNGSSGWTFDGNVLLHLEDETWSSFDLGPSSTNAIVGVMDLGGSAALVLFANRLARFDARARTFESIRENRHPSFTSLLRSIDGSFWIVSRDMISAVHATGPALRASWRWTDYPIPNGLGVGSIRSAATGAPGELFVSGIAQAAEARLALWLRNGKWTIVTRQTPSRRLLQHWHDRDYWWMADGNALYRRRFMAARDAGFTGETTKRSGRRWISWRRCSPAGFGP